MKLLLRLVTLVGFFGVATLFVGSAKTADAAPAQTITFSSYEWNVRSGGGGPGPNTWDARNVWVDSNGYLHLMIAYRDGNWTTAELTSTGRFGFGKYQFQVIGAIDTLDKNVVLGLFNYPPPDVGPDTTNEIDIEIARWGNAVYPNGNFTVWAPKLGLAAKSRAYEFALDGTYTTQRFTWSRQSILFQSLYGHRNNNKNEFARWNFQPKHFLNRIPQNPLPVHMNLWLFQGNAPTNSQPVEVIIRRFTFTSN